MKKVLLAIAALSIMASLAGCPGTDTAGTNSSAGNNGSSTESK